MQTSRLILEISSCQFSSIQQCCLSRNKWQNSSLEPGPDWCSPSKTGGKSRIPACIPFLLEGTRTPGKAGPRTHKTSLWPYAKLTPNKGISAIFGKPTGPTRGFPELALNYGTYFRDPALVLLEMLSQKPHGLLPSHFPLFDIQKIENVPGSGDNEEFATFPC